MGYIWWNGIVKWGGVYKVELSSKVRWGISGGIGSKVGCIKWNRVLKVAGCIRWNVVKKSG